VINTNNIPHLLLKDIYIIYCVVVPVTRSLV
jgi:hypothetical protein